MLTYACWAGNRGSRKDAIIGCQFEGHASIPPQLSDHRPAGLSRPQVLHIQNDGTEFSEKSQYVQGSG